MIYSVRLMFVFICLIALLWQGAGVKCGCRDEVDDFVCY
jgi:hypothetical protein